MLLGLALAQHCNLQCVHCIRDDVCSVRFLDASLVVRVVDEARTIFNDVAVSFTGGEPLLHPALGAIAAQLADRRTPWRLVSNGWYLRRALPILDAHPPEYVRLSLSGATEDVHDQERGRGSFRRVLQAVAILTSRRIPTALSLVIDRRDRHQVRRAADLAESLGCQRLHLIRPQPVPGSTSRQSDLSQGEWDTVREVVLAIAAEPLRQTRLSLDYGAGPDTATLPCDTLAMRRLYVDAQGRLSVCCQLSHYGGNETDVVADLNRVSLAGAWPRLQDQLATLASAVTLHGGAPTQFDHFPCLRCAGVFGKLEWIGKPASRVRGQTPPLMAPECAG